MHTPRRKYQLTLHSITEFHRNSNNLSKIGIQIFCERDARFSEPYFPPIERHTTKTLKIHHPKIKSVLFCPKSL